MIQRREKVCLALKACETFRVSGKRFREKLQRDLAAELRISYEPRRTPEDRLIEWADYTARQR